MRAGLIVGGVFVMLIAVFCFFTIILIPLALLFGLVGFIMLIVGCVTSPPKPSPPATPMVVHGPPQAASTVRVICPECRSHIPSEARFCPECGEDLKPKRRAALSDMQVKSMVLGYIRNRGGELDVDECAEELELTVQQVRKTIRILKKEGKLEEEE